jgi:hypothetical protein
MSMLRQSTSMPVCVGVNNSGDRGGGGGVAY